MISANYFDGRSARLHPVNLELGEGTIGLAGADLVKSYPLSEVRFAEPFQRASAVLDFADGARCEIPDPGAQATVAAALGYRKSRVVRWQDRWVGALAALVLLVATVLATVKWGIPALAERIVASLPVSIDKKVGDTAFDSLEGSLLVQSRLSDEIIAEVGEIFRSVAPVTTRIPLRLRVMGSDSLPPNALALPNGTIVITDGMILHVVGKKLNFTDEAKARLAGVLAHEIGHVEGRHSMGALARSSLTAVGAAALFGDFSTVVAGAPTLLLNMDYSRDMERRADDYAITRMAQAGLPPLALAELFDSLEAADPGQGAVPRWMQRAGSYLSSHPATRERSNYIRQRSVQLQEK
ncbi:MAG: M48 family metallopeptidase [Telluria sp.]